MAPALPQLREVALDDKYELESGRVYLTGAQAFVRLLILQRQRDQLAGLNTGGFVSGYRGSPLGALDQSLWKAQKFLDRANVKFQPGLNEDLAATSIWGTQQLNLHKDAKVDGVFAMWYGKGPGVDRCGDVFKHANMAGTSKHGGVLVLAGDDHAAKSSTVPHQSDHMFSRGDDAGALPVVGAGNPRPRPARLGDVALLRLLGRLQVRGRHGRELVVGRHRSVAHQDHHAGRLPVPGRRRVDPLARRLPRHRSADAGLQDLRGAALLPRESAEQDRHRFARAPPARLGIATSGKSYQDVRQALEDLGITGAGRRRDGPARVQGRDAVAARARRRAAVRRRPRGNPRRRGKAADRRVPAEGTALQLARRRASARRRQVRRKGRMGAPARRLAAAGRRRAHARDDRARDRQAHRTAEPASAPPGTAARARGLDQRQGKGAGQARHQPRAPALLLLRAARTTRRPSCPTAAARPPASAAT